MADPVEPVTTTSYSDPIYDRLEALSHRIKRAKWAIIGAIILAVVGGLILRSVLENRPEARSAVAFVKAMESSDPAERRTALETLAASDQETAFFRARAAVELAQMAIAEGKADAARPWIDKASTHAAQAGSDQLDLVVRLAKAAAAEDLGEYDAALADYSAVERSGISAFPVHGLLGALGAARIEVVQNKAADAVARLEPYQLRAEPELAMILNDIRLLYWQAKRAVDGEPVTVPDPAAPAAPATTPEAAPAPEAAAPAPEAPAPAPEAPAAQTQQ